MRLTRGIGLLIEQLLRVWIERLLELVHVAGAIDGDLGHFVGFHVVGELLVERLDQFWLSAVMWSACLRWYLMRATSPVSREACWPAICSSDCPTAGEKLAPWRVGWRLSG